MNDSAPILSVDDHVYIGSRTSIHGFAGFYSNLITDRPWTLIDAMKMMKLGKELVLTMEMVICDWVRFLFRFEHAYFASQTTVERKIIFDLLLSLVGNDSSHHNLLDIPIWCQLTLVRFDPKYK